MLKKIIVTGVIAVVFSVAMQLQAKTDSTNVIAQTQDETVSIEKQIPSFASRLKSIPDFLLKNKREGHYFTAFPAIGVDPDTGFNIGAYVQFFNNKKKTDPFFEITPYRDTFQFGGVVTTKKVFQLYAYYDSPFIMDTPWRIRGEAQLFYNPLANYFGIGNNGQQLTFPGTGQVYGSYNAYKNALKEQAGGETNEDYDIYQYTNTFWRGSAEYNLIGGWIRLLGGFQVAHTWIDDYTGKTVSGAVQRTTHLQEDCNAGTAKGCKGGWDNFIKLGVVFDTRDYEPDPDIGIMWEGVFEYTPKILGSSRNYGRLSSSLRGFGKIFETGRQKLIIANRFFYQSQFGDVPFYAMSSLAFTDLDRSGLGGFQTIRGYVLNRFIGPVTMVNSTELRYSFFEFNVFHQHLKVGVKPFLDVGRAFDKVSDTSFKDWHIAGGAGLMLAWNVATVISFDQAWSSEGSAFYMTLGAQF